jgi:hypothetical protein
MTSTASRTTSSATSVSVHLLANDTNWVWRHQYGETTGAAMAFRSGYVNAGCDPSESGTPPAS